MSLKVPKEGIKRSLGYQTKNDEAKRWLIGPEAETSGAVSMGWSKDGLEVAKATRASGLGVDGLSKKKEPIEL
jgi:hypothetical protein